MSDKNKPENERSKEDFRKKEPDKTGHADLSDSCFSKSICSATDCTGLIPALPSSEEELESYEEMYQFCLEGAARQDRPEDDALRV